jgi:hypothetical protein
MDTTCACMQRTSCVVIVRHAHRQGDGTRSTRLLMRGALGRHARGHVALPAAVLGERRDGAHACASSTRAEGLRGVRVSISEERKRRRKGCETA